MSGDGGVSANPLDDESLWAGRTVIETERLILRGFRKSDLPAFAALHRDPEVMRFVGGTPLDRAVSDGIAAAAQRQFLKSGDGKIAVERRADGAFLGMCGLSVEDWYPDDLEVGWRLAQEFWGHGYATEAGIAWVDHAFATMGARRVISVADTPNVRSIGVMQRIGLAFDHEARLSDENGAFDATIYAIDAAAWRDISG